VPRFVPIKASIAPYKIFCDSHPIVLNASVTPTALPLEIDALFTVASINEVLLALIVTSPVAPPVALVLTVVSLR